CYTLYSNLVFFYISLYLYFFTLFHYTTLFRSDHVDVETAEFERVRVPVVLRGDELVPGAGVNLVHVEPTDADRRGGQLLRVGERRRADHHAGQVGEGEDEVRARPVEGQRDRVLVHHVDRVDRLEQRGR